MTWNTLHIEQARGAEPKLLTDDFISKVAPIAHWHFNLRGMFKFDLGAPPLYPAGTDQERDFVATRNLILE